MLSVSQDWIDAQSEALRPESNVYIRKSGYELSKKDLNTFSYKQSGKIDNSIIPTKEIYFEIFNDQQNFNEGDIVEVYFAFYLNSAWEEINVGKFLINKVERPKNGLISKFNLTSYFTKIGSAIKSLDELYIDGSNTPYNDTDKSLVSLFNQLGGNTTYSPPVIYVNQGMEKMSYGEALQSVAIFSCSTLLPKYNTSYSTEYYYTNIDVINASVVSDYIVLPFIQYEKPEITKDTEYKRVELLLTYTTNNFNIYISLSDFPAYDKAQVNVSANSTYTMEYDGGTYRDIITNRQQGFWHCEDNVLYIENNTGSAIAVNLYMNRILQDNRFAPKTFYVDLTSSSNNVLKITNPFICKSNDKNRDSDFNSIVNYVAQCKQHSQLLNVNCRIDPRLELFDKIKVIQGDTYYTIVAEQIKISYNGGFRGSIEGRIFAQEQKLATPPVSTPSALGVMSITKVPNATHYDMYVNDVLYHTYGSGGSSTTILVLLRNELTDPNVYNIKVKARADGYIDSDFSNEVQYIVYSQSPVIIEKTINSASDYRFVIKNMSDDEQTLCVYWSGIIIEVSLAQFDNYYIEAGDERDIDDAVDNYLRGQLADDLICYYDGVGNDVVILEANDNA